ncbi:3-phosphoserine/phosphohydroxythreonine transaminase [Companilactobacillus sp.]|uniref:3-phosphoserine/phosphohydroxythreonine transaminase n=1 Tax=Companilactobacillus sp. TaxID=2767905 RepID=UPI0025BB3A90|nr:3-phosphoserine/phosphohydroxythreonine transaminase [Companilactobacillus sp.]MCH4009886.1 3-phosphoserine/phosphohydroxythreonine transaminase [Companilactobacillus sp.]MCH4052438.1 3-phosphoserine/phosphohydroxythreonine transaminase [Companilactobacillus sp.]MCH4077828.1 3-phosphoserine/phosphohydroxythreonine transaminase [Companilactobacillus sp.]MCH4126404.1 3-phosphoserine/phosphohydroxythreonine transaminase [Companilactobacillus sp.]MCI1312726.1 3-phosphoserine/phosphohydroxythreo
MTIYNFSAGPATMPDPVIVQIKADLPSYKNSGMSVMEISHRSALFDDIINQAQQDLRDLLQIPDNYSVLFFQGGGTLQFTAAPLNLATKYHRIGLLDSGHWADRAGDEASRVNVKVDVLASTKDDKYTHLPEMPDLKQNTYDYVHICTNNTIEGTAYTKLPDTGDTELVGDMSSNFMGQQYNVKDFGAIMAGAQKNLGIAGLTIVIVRNDLIGKAQNLPSMLDYELFAKKNSMFNTPPVFAIYAAGLVLKWLKEQGGVAEMERRNRKKSNLLYDFLDESKMFTAPVVKADRSLVNVPFVTGNKDLDAKLISEATEQGLLNIKGHRSVGGMRASLYNAMPYEGVEKLVDFLNNFEKNNGGVQ